MNRTAEAMSLESLMDYDEHKRERRERLDAERAARGEPAPVFVWTPPPPTPPPKRKRQRGNRPTSA